MKEEGFIEVKVEEILLKKFELMKIEFRTEVLHKTCDFLEKMNKDQKRANMITTVGTIFWIFLGIFFLIKSL